MLSEVALKLPFDPVERAREVESVVMLGDKRKYYRLRFSRYYGGIVTADAVGCCFLCAYCWNYNRNLNYKNCKGFYLSPSEVARKLVEIAKKRACSRFRISGCEPILGEKSTRHLVEVIRKVRSFIKPCEFVVETNGLMLGYEEKLAEHLREVKDVILVRISIKGYDERSFELISGAKREYFRYPFLALKKLLSLGIAAWPAVMYETFGASGIEKVNRILKEMGIRPEELEVEYLELYSFVKRNLKKRGIELKAQ